MQIALVQYLRIDDAIGSAIFEKINTDIFYGRGEQRHHPPRYYLTTIHRDDEYQTVLNKKWPFGPLACHATLTLSHKHIILHPL